MSAAGSHGDEPGRRANVRTALVLASIAAAFFIGIVIKYVFFP